MLIEVLFPNRSRGEMDITTVFGTVVPGSSPGGSTKRSVSQQTLKDSSLFILLLCLLKMTFIPFPIPQTVDNSGDMLIKDSPIRKKDLAFIPILGNKWLILINVSRARTFHVIYETSF